MKRRNQRRPRGSRPPVSKYRRKLAEREKTTSLGLALREALENTPGWKPQ